MHTDDNPSQDQASTRLDYSLVIPVFDERDSLRELFTRIQGVMPALGSYEVVFVDDGSVDGSGEVLAQLQAEHPQIVSIVTFKRNWGKAAALREGFKVAAGRLIVMLDADLQDQPEEIPKLVRAMEQGNLDVVTGWKKVRHDSKAKTLPSKLFNWTMQRFSTLSVHDFNCGLKLMRAECAKRLELYGQLHRYLLVLLTNQGFSVGEVPVEHSPRRHGQSKFGHKRLYEGLMDFWAVFFLTRFLQTPLYFFGFYGLAFMVLAVLIGGFFLLSHLYSLASGLTAYNLREHPIWIISPIFLLAGLICFFFGLVGQLIIHLHFTQAQAGEGILETSVSLRRPS